MAKKQPGERDIDRIIGNNLDRLRKTGVLTVRPGFEMGATRLTATLA